MGARQAAVRGEERGSTNRRLPSAAPEERRPSGRLGAKVPTSVVVEVERGADESPAENRGPTRRW